LSDAECDIGDGGYELRKLLRPGIVRGGNQEGHKKSVLQAMAGFVEARFEEMLRPNEWPRTWGAAFEMMVLQEGRFRWLPDLTYIGWDVMVDDNIGS
jgi:hypothetical protein